MALLEVREVVKTYGGIVAVSNASFDVDAGSITALIGPNGAGKTAAFDTITGVVQPDSGSVVFDGVEITGRRPYSITERGVGRTFQITRELGDMTVLENMVVSTVPNSIRSLFGGRMTTAQRDRAMDLLRFVGIEKLAHQPAKRLSYGQRKLLEIAGGLMTDPRLILLDEPAAGVNPALLERILDRIREANQAGTSFLIVEHNMDVVMQLSHSVIVMAHGSVLLQDTPEAVRNDERVLDAYLGAV